MQLEHPRLPLLEELDLCGCRAEDAAVEAFLAAAEPGLDKGEYQKGAKEPRSSQEARGLENRACEHSDKDRTVLSRSSENPQPHMVPGTDRCFNAGSGQALHTLPGCTARFSPLDAVASGEFWLRVARGTVRRNGRRGNDFALEGTPGRHAYPGTRLPGNESQFSRG